MASSTNRVFLLGTLGRDPEVRYTPSGQAVCNFSLATNERYKDRDGQWKERTEWHRIVVWGKSAESCGQYLGKGRQAVVEGRLQTREWTDKQGIKRESTEIVADRVHFVGGPQDAPRTRAQPYSAPQPAPRDEGELPF